MNSRLEEVRKIVAEVLDVDAATLSPDDSRETLEAWDSIAHLNIIMSLEASFDLDIDLEHAMDLASIQGIVSYLSAQLGSDRAAPS